MFNLTHPHLKKKMYKRVKKSHILIFDETVYYLIKINGNEVISYGLTKVSAIKYSEKEGKHLFIWKNSVLLGEKK